MATDERRLIEVTNLAALGAGNPELEADLWHELRTLADDLNSDLSAYEARLVHLDTADYLEFIGRDEDHDDGDFWAAEQAEREAIVKDLLADGEEAGPDPAQGQGALDPLARAKRDLAALERGEQVDLSAWGVRDLRT